MKILIIEDQATERKLATEILAWEGHEVYQADSGEAGVKEVARQLPEMILVDMSLPGMTGMDVVELLKSNADTRQIPVVAMTSFPETYRRAEALAVGCAGYIAKPLNVRTLSMKLEELLLQVSRSTEPEQNL